MTGRARAFWLVFALLALAKGGLATVLPLFGDEAWYWLEGQHLASAYSDLPGLTAWLIRLGTSIAGDTPLGVRWPFLLMSMALPWLVRATAAAWFGEDAGWRAAWLALLMPLLGALGLLALPDVPMTLAAAMCLLACARMTNAARSMPDHRVHVRGHDVVLLAAGLALGALSHYRFALIVVAGFVGLLLDPQGRRVLCAPRAWIAILIGALAWVPLLAWNLAHHGAGFEFQLAERHPWAPHAGGFWFVPVQLAIASPLLALAGVLALVQACKRWRAQAPGPWGLVLGSAAVPLLLYGTLAFVADRERVSFHWTLQAWLPLLCVAPQVLANWSRGWRVATHLLALAGLVALLAFAALGAWPQMRAHFADSGWYPDNFAGWREIAEATGDLDDLAADNFMLGAQLAFARGDAALPILDHPLNRKHGRAVQLAAWGQGSAATTARWLVVEDSAVPLRDRLAHYHALCERLGDLPVARTIQIDHGRKRFLLLDLARRAVVCRTPALAWVDAPAPGATASGTLRIAGWAFKDGAGIARIQATLDGKVVGDLAYGQPREHVAKYWRISRDPAHPNVGFSGEVPLAGVAPGEHWLGLVLHGRDGSVEGWPQQRILVR